MKLQLFILKLFLFIDFRKEGGEREFPSSMHSLVGSCPDQGLNLHPWHIGTMLYPTEPPGQGWLFSF